MLENQNAFLKNFINLIMIRPSLKFRRENSMLQIPEDYNIERRVASRVWNVIWEAKCLRVFEPGVISSGPLTRWA